VTLSQVDYKELTYADFERAEEILGQLMSLPRVYGQSESQSLGYGSKEEVYYILEIGYCLVEMSMRLYPVEEMELLE
jgi:hypothetical protein